MTPVATRPHRWLSLQLDHRGLLGSRSTVTRMISGCLISVPSFRVTVDHVKIEFRLFNFSSIFNVTLREKSLFTEVNPIHGPLSCIHGTSCPSRVPCTQLEGHPSPPHPSLPLRLDLSLTFATRPMTPIATRPMTDIGTSTWRPTTFRCMYWGARPLWATY